MSGRRLQDGTAVRRINDAITAFQAYEQGETEKAASSVLNTLRNIQIHVGLAWPAILRYCFIHAASHIGVIRLLVDLSVTTKLGMFTILASSGHEDPFSDVGIIFSKACSVLKLSDADFLSLPSKFMADLQNFFSVQAANAHISVETGLFDIEDKYAYRTMCIGDIVLMYYKATVEQQSWVSQLVANSSTNRIDADTMIARIVDIRDGARSKISKFCATYNSSEWPHFKTVANAYTRDWDVPSTVQPLMHSTLPEDPAIKLTINLDDDVSSNTSDGFNREIISMGNFDDSITLRNNKEEDEVIDFDSLVGSN